MATPDISKITLKSLPNTLGVYNVADLDTHIASFKKAIKSAIGKDDLFVIRDKIIDQATGEALIEVLVDDRNKDLVYNALSQKIGKMFSADYSIAKGISVPMKSRTIEGLFGEKAVAIARENVTSMGGTLKYTPTDKQPDLYTYTVPYEGRLTDKRRKDLESTLFTEALTESATARLKEQSTIDKAEEKQRKEENKKKDDNRKAVLGTALKVFGTLTVLTDIARRILSSVLTLSTQTLREATTAHNLGMSYSTMREFSNLEVAHGIQKGTIAGALTDIQSKFGNITSLDENALSALALVMGSDIRNLVESGMGGANPEELLGNILDAFNARANAGYNSVGQYVGEQQARRELYSYLSKISPQIADLFAKMQEERNNINSIYRGQVETFEEWKRSFQTNRGGFTTADYGVVQTLGQYTDQIKGIAEQIKQGVMITLAPKLVEILSKIAGTTVGLKGDELLEQSAKNRKLNEQNLANVNKMISSLPSENDVADPRQKLLLQARKRALEERKRALEEANKRTDLEGVKLVPFNESILESSSSEYVSNILTEAVITNQVPSFLYEEAVQSQYDTEAIQSWKEKYIKAIKRAIIKGKYKGKEEKEELKKAGLTEGKGLPLVSVEKSFYDATDEEIEAQAEKLTYMKLGYGDVDKKQIDKYIEKVGIPRLRKEAQSSPFALGSFIEGENINWSNIDVDKLNALMGNTVYAYTTGDKGEKRVVLAIDINNDGTITHGEDMVVYTSGEGVDFGSNVMQAGKVQVTNGKVEFINALQQSASEAR